MHKYNGNFRIINKDSKFIDRIVYINDVIYTLSGKCVKANDYNSMKELGTLDF
ncbi:MAG: hypothetical protein Q8942_06305 [Bacillota bacterium]|nr:hypothetical protein [Bacillota bacterium]